MLEISPGSVPLANCARRTTCDPYSSFTAFFLGLT